MVQYNVFFLRVINNNFRFDTKNFNVKYKKAREINFIEIMRYRKWKTQRLRDRARGSKSLKLFYRSEVERGYMKSTRDVCISKEKRKILHSCNNLIKHRELQYIVYVYIQIGW